MKIENRCLKYSHCDFCQNVLVFVNVLNIKSKTIGAWNNRDYR